MTRIDAIIFDKDGTLFDFHLSWSGWAERVLRDIGGGDPLQMRLAGAAIGYDLDAHAFHNDSVVIAGTAKDIAAALSSVISMPASDLAEKLNAAAKATELVPVVGVFETLETLAAQMTLGLVTNDAEVPARAHLERAGLAGHFTFVAGYDSGFGAKPAPGQLLAFTEATGMSPANTLMVGDSRHDLSAGRAAGMRTVAVLTGIATADELSDLADVTLADVSLIPGWIDSLPLAS